MPLTVAYYPSASAAMGDALSHLQRATAATDLFGEVHVLVPTVGMRSWLSEHLSSTLGSSGLADGVVANIKFHMPTVLSRGSFAKHELEPWPHDHVVALLFEHLSACTLPSDETNNDSVHSFVANSGGPLSAAVRLAGMFNKYSSRRLAMLRLWAQGQASLMPVASEVGGDDTAAELASNDMWQFEAWRFVFEQMNQAHPRMNESNLLRDAESITHLLVFGFETLDHDTIALLRRYGGVAEVSVMLVAPSAAVVRSTAPAVASAAPAEKAPRTRRVGETCPPELRRALHLPFHWYRGVRETLELLAANGVSVTKHGGEPWTPKNQLSRLQAVIRTGNLAGDHATPSTVGRKPVVDESIELHLCHGKARQAEVAADAVIAALQDRVVPDLQLHDIAIVTPDVPTMAPHLQAAFGKTVKLEFEPEIAANLGNPECERLAEVRLPLVVADRSIGELNAGARFFSDLLTLIAGRVDKLSFFELIQQPEFADLREFGQEQFDRWWLLTERAGQRWAIDNRHRASRVGDNDASSIATLSDKHTWLDTARRVLLGAIATRDTKLPSPDRVPIEDVDAEELRDVLQLLELIDSISDAARDVEHGKPITEWVTVLIRHLRRLCGGDVRFARVPFAELDELRRIGLRSNRIVEFKDVRLFLQGQFGVVPDASYRRDGRILVTNMASQHLVERRVVCVVGLDDSSLPSGAVDGNDLTGRQVVEGDSDPRHDLRRQLLDAVMSASDRVILTCDGRSSKNNQKIDLITPLEELLEYSREVGAEIPSRQHPRHRLSEKNFLISGDVSESGAGNQPLGRPWSYDVAARDIVKGSRDKAASEITRPVPMLVEQAAPLLLTELKKMLTTPISVFLEQQLKVFHVWEDEEHDYGVVPLELERDQFVVMLRELLASSGDSDDVVVADWRHREQLPLTVAAEEAAINELQSARAAIDKLLSLRYKSKKDTETLPVPLRICAEEEFRLVLPLGQKIDHRVPVLSGDQTAVALLRPDRLIKEHSRWRFVDEIALEALFAVAAGVSFTEWYVIAESESEWMRFEVTFEKLPEGTEARRQVAAAWLSELTWLWGSAAGLPMPTFGKEREDSVGQTFYIDAELKAAADEFFDFVTPDGKEYRRPFAQSDEALVFGAEPEFGNCFVAGGHESLFWMRRHLAWSVKETKVRSVPRRIITVRAPSGSPVAASSQEGSGHD
jgi:exodeoxyribonuclease V gamma subunit